MKLRLLRSSKLKPTERLVYSYLAAKLYFSDNEGGKAKSYSERWIARKTKLGRSTVKTAANKLEFLRLINKRDGGWQASPPSALFHRRRGQYSHWYQGLAYDYLVYKDNFRPALVLLYQRRCAGIRETSRLTGLSLTTVRRYWQPYLPNGDGDEAGHDAQWQAAENEAEARCQRIVVKRVDEIVASCQVTDEEKPEIKATWLRLIDLEAAALISLGVPDARARTMVSVVLHYDYKKSSLAELFARQIVSGMYKVVRKDRKPQASLFLNCQAYLGIMDREGRDYDPFAIRIEGTTLTAPGPIRRLKIPKKKEKNSLT